MRLVGRQDAVEMATLQRNSDYLIRNLL